MLCVSLREWHQPLLLAFQTSVRAEHSLHWGPFLQHRRHRVLLWFFFSFFKVHFGQLCLSD